MPSERKPFQSDRANFTLPKRVLKAASWILFGDPAQRRRVRQECARIAAAIFGDFPISEDYKLWRQDKQFLFQCQTVAPDSPYSHERRLVLRELARFTKNVPGAMAECGCYEGASAYFMAKERPDTPLHLFDSFKGLSPPTNQDRPKFKEGMEWVAGDLSASAQTVRETLKGFSNISLHQGWIPTRFYEVAEETFSLVHIDVDLYQPTRDSLEFFYPRVNPGGVIVFDDYGFTTCPGAHQAVTEYMADKPEYVLHLPTAQGLLIKA